MRFNLERRSFSFTWGSGIKGMLVLILLISGLLTGCNAAMSTPPSPLVNSFSQPIIKGKLSEVSTPPLIEQLASSLDQYQPQVKIISPRPDEILKDTKVAVKLNVEDLPIFENADLEMGPHIHLIVDNRPYQAIYNVDEPIVLKDLEPGTHTLRAFPVRPWHESFKNDGAYAQLTFHVLTKSSENHPDPALPLLTYSRPKGSYGAEPILLDFYLTNAPLHLVAQENKEDAIADWRIRVTINDESFLLDHWQSVYLKGFEKGQNWVKLEFIDEQGNLVPNSFNNTVRVIDYQPNGQDSLSKLVRGEIPLAIAKALVDKNVNIPVTPTEEVSPPNPEAEIPTVAEEKNIEQIAPIQSEEVLKSDTLESSLSPESEQAKDASEPIPTVTETAPVEFPLESNVKKAIAPTSPDLSTPTTQISPEETNPPELATENSLNSSSTLKPEAEIQAQNNSIEPSLTSSPIGEESTTSPAPSNLEAS